ncbi:hypothetical protein PUN28_017346 [Cardiocondyla obscurior]|uniref:Secreted protein n=1 Tax=Cardiocondyla obscurior TaxID=286306 RepID=A0AAW2ER89_9HYME
MIIFPFFLFLFFFLRRVFFFYLSPRLARELTKRVDVKYYFSPGLRRWRSRYHTNCKLKTRAEQFRAGGEAPRWRSRPLFPSRLYKNCVLYFSAE